MEKLDAYDWKMRKIEEEMRRRDDRKQARRGN